MCAHYLCKADAIPAFPGRTCYPAIFIRHQDKTDTDAENWMPT